MSAPRLAAFYLARKLPGYTYRRWDHHWFDPVGGVEQFLPDRFPIYIWEVEGGATPYGFPAIDGRRGGVKLAFYRAPREEPCTPETIVRNIRESEIEQK